MNTFQIFMLFIIKDLGDRVEGYDLTLGKGFKRANLEASLWTDYTDLLERRGDNSQSSSQCANEKKNIKIITAGISRNHKNLVKLTTP